MKQKSIARAQYHLTPSDLELVLAMVRTGTLAGASERLRVDPSTVFRGLQRIERGLGTTLFHRSRTGYAPAELALALAEQAEVVETAVEAARSAAQLLPEQVSGTVRITTTDSVLHSVVGPALKSLRELHPLLAFDLHSGNELADLTRRDADIAVRSTKRPPPHLVGRRLGPIRQALFAAKNGPVKRYGQVEAGQAAWIGIDDAQPEHPSVLWRKRHFPKAAPLYRVRSLLVAAGLVEAGLGVAVLPMVLAAQRPLLRALTPPLDEVQTELWLLTHPESRHLRRIATVYAHLAETIRLE
ncbi:MAG TPA: LysR family transcriptional regulator [Burkholderiaceae bacterium]|nr:LysR family transcriptional regulator [Burkholderiaceae bacterium]